MSETRFHGVFPYLVSPLDDAGNVKADVLARLCEDLIKGGVHGLTPLGSTGEFAYLSRAQRRRVVEVVVETAAGRVYACFRSPAGAVSLPVVPYTNPSFQRSGLGLPVIKRRRRARAVPRTGRLGAARRQQHAE